MLAAIERATRQTVTPMHLPTREDVVGPAGGAVQAEDHRRARLARTSRSSSSSSRAMWPSTARSRRNRGSARVSRPEGPAVAATRRQPAAARGTGARTGCCHARHASRPGAASPGRRAAAPAAGAAAARRGCRPAQGQLRYRIEVGHEHGVQPGNIVGAIANEAGIDSANIGRIDIFDSYSTVDLPEGMPKAIQQRLRKAWVCGQQLAISVDSGGDAPPRRPPPGLKAERSREGQPRPHRKRSHE